ncbi:MAG TPA: prephenate dehydratase [Gammaproteobacteria bacterium]|nr:prephenate dehydratase [Gammaproteobacteria bacterium]
MIAMNVSYLGPKGSFSEIALLAYFGNNATTIPMPSIGDVFNSVENKETTYGIIPIENSIEGSVNNSHDLLMESNVLISGEIELPINQCLLSKNFSKEGVNILYSHSQSLAQCQNWIKSKLPKIKIVPVISNSEGATMIKKDNEACIGSEKLSKDYNLNILEYNIQDFPDNTTRFLIIGREVSEKSNHNKTSIIVSPSNTSDSGSLFKVLKPFSNHNVNLSRIESRPSKMGKWSYVFFIDLEGHISDESLINALSELEKLNIQFKNLGSYPISSDS